MTKSFFIISNPDNTIFYQDFKYPITSDKDLAKHFSNCEEAENVLSNLTNNDNLTVKKVTIIIE